MGISIQKVGDRVEFFDDGDLLALFGLLNETAAKAPANYPSLQSFIENWRQNCINSGPGTIRLKLDDVAASYAARMELQQLLADVERELGKFGEKVPASLLNTLCKVRGVKLYDYDVTLIKSAIERIRALIS